ncbi:hypothetical protein DENSPDRAFT_852450 [Dentipellis sp. KUC8613]|nr:hypothetical protein DENSPDRAFT_852450 [Dentipellis sp. KUC8613]
MPSSRPQPSSTASPAHPLHGYLAALDASLDHRITIGDPHRSFHAFFSREGRILSTYTTSRINSPVVWVAIGHFDPYPDTSLPQLPSDPTDSLHFNTTLSYEPDPPPVPSLEWYDHRQPWSAYRPTAPAHTDNWIFFPDQDRQMFEGTERGVYVRPAALQNLRRQAAFVEDLGRTLASFLGISHFPQPHPNSLDLHDDSFATRPHADQLARLQGTRSEILSWWGFIRWMIAHAGPDWRTIPLRSHLRTQLAIPGLLETPSIGTIFDAALPVEYLPDVNLLLRHDIQVRYVWRPPTEDRPHLSALDPAYHEGRDWNVTMQRERKMQKNQQKRTRQAANRQQRQAWQAHNNRPQPDGHYIPNPHPPPPPPQRRRVNRHYWIFDSREDEVQLKVLNHKSAVQDDLFSTCRLIRDKPSKGKWAFILDEDALPGDKKHYGGLYEGEAPESSSDDGPLTGAPHIQDVRMMTPPPPQPEPAPSQDALAPTYARRSMTPPEPADAVSIHSGSEDNLLSFIPRASPKGKGKRRASPSPPPASPPQMDQDDADTMAAVIAASRDDQRRQELRQAQPHAGTSSAHTHPSPTSGSISRTAQSTDRPGSSSATPRSPPHKTQAKRSRRDSHSPAPAPARRPRTFLSQPPIDRSPSSSSAPPSLVSRISSSSAASPPSTPSSTTSALPALAGSSLLARLNAPAHTPTTTRLSLLQRMQDPPAAAALSQPGTSQPVSVAPPPPVPIQSTPPNLLAGPDLSIHLSQISGSTPPTLSNHTVSRFAPAFPMHISGFLYFSDRSLLRVLHWIALHGTENNALLVPWLLARGIPFHWRVPFTPLPALPPLPYSLSAATTALWHTRPGGAIYDDWRAAVQQVLARPHARRWFLEGGLLWRIALEFSTPEIRRQVFEGPSLTATLYGRGDTYNILQAVIGDGAFTEEDAELNILLGRVTNQSLWPAPTIWSSTSMWVGEWSAADEVWFQCRLASLSNGPLQFLPEGQWRSRLRDAASTENRRLAQREGSDRRAQELLATHPAASVYRIIVLDGIVPPNPPGTPPPEN